MSSRFWLALLLAAPVIALSAGCGSGESEEQKAEVELEEARSAVEAIDKKAEHASDEALKLSDTVIKMLDESSEAIELGELSRYRELQPAIREMRAESNRLYRVSNEMPYSSETPAGARYEKVEAHLEEIRGCDKACQRERETAIEENSDCSLSLFKAEVSFKEAEKICNRRYPIPHEDILHLKSDEDDE
jgi:uncharacterized lipoprotein